MKNRLVPFLLFLSGTAAAQYLIQPGKSAAMGGASVVFQDVNALFGNQAGLAFLKNISALVVAERRFGMTELQTVAAGVCLPTRSGTFGLGIQSFGFEEFRQQKLGLSYSRLFGKNFAASVQFDYFQVRISEFGSKSVLTFEAGIQAMLGKNLILGTHVFSPAPVEWTENENLPAILRLGLSWQPSEKSMIVFEAEKDVDFPVRLKGGFEYQVAQPLWFRAGFGSNPATFHTGISIQINPKIKTDAAGNYHQILGFTPSATVIYER